MYNISQNIKSFILFLLNNRVLQIVGLHMSLYVTFNNRVMQTVGLYMSLYVTFNNRVMQTVGLYMSLYVTFMLLPQYQK